MLKIQIIYNRHSDGTSGTRSKTLKKPRRHIASIIWRQCGGDGGGEGDCGAENENDSPSDYVGEGRPKEGAEGETESRDGDSPVYFGEGESVVGLDEGKGGDGGGRDISEEEVPVQ